MTRRKDPVTEAPGPTPEPMDETAAPVPLTDADLAAPRRRSGFLAALLGGAVAATGGFGLAHFDAFGLRAPTAPDLTAEVAALQDQLARLTDQASGSAAAGNGLAALEVRLAALESRPAPETPDLSGLTALEDRLAAIEALPEGDVASNATLSARLARLETALQTLPATDTTALQAELDAALTRLSSAEAEAATRTELAETAAAEAARDLALRALTEAVTAGQPFETELQLLADPALDAALRPMAATGAPSLASLQAVFPDAARETLSHAREISDQDGWTDRLFDFLAAQTEARSLTPHDGSDPDAILSRAEFALAEGRIADALTELTALDPALAAPLQDWTRDATRHLAATTALAAAGEE